MQFYILHFPFVGLSVYLGSPASSEFIADQSQAGRAHQPMKFDAARGERFSGKLINTRIIGFINRRELCDNILTPVI